MHLKIAADWAKTSRMSNFLILSLAVLNKGEEVMSLHGQTTIAILDAKENLFQLKNLLQKFFRNLMHYLKQKMMKAICPTLQTLQIKLQTRIFFEW